MVVKRRKKKPGLEEKAFGPEPIFEVGQTPTEEPARSREWLRSASWYNYYNKSKDHLEYILRFAKEEMKFTPKKLALLKKLKEYELTGDLAHAIRIYYRGWEYTPSELKSFKTMINNRYQSAKALEAPVVKKADGKVQPILSVHDRLVQKVNNTIMVDFDHLIESWMNQTYNAKFDAFTKFRTYGLKNPAVDIFRRPIESMHSELYDAINGQCEQAVEAYAHISKPDLRKMLKTTKLILTDLDALKESFKAVKTIRKSKPKTSDKQVERLNYCKENMAAKLTSINPVGIPGAHTLYTYNIKSRKLTEFKTDSDKTGFTVSGSTLKNVDFSKSRVTTIRDKLLPEALKKPNKVWKKVTTKIGVPTGRINKDTILLKVIT